MSYSKQHNSSEVIPENQVEYLIVALLDYALAECTSEKQQKIKGLNCEWKSIEEGNCKLRVPVNDRDLLVQLLKKTSWALSRKQISEALRQLDDSELLEGREKKRGPKSEILIFKLPSQDKNECLRELRNRKNQRVGQKPKDPLKTSSPDDTKALQTIIKNKTKGFIGREYVFEAIQKFLQKENCGYFTIKAKPGIGKSAILAEYVRRNNCVAYFNVRSEGINRAEQFLESVCIQLIKRYELNHLPSPTQALQDSAFLSSLLDEVFQKNDGESVVIAIDALDEVDLASQTPGSNILYLPANLPPGVFIILTTRSDVSLPFNVQAPQEVLDLMSKTYEEESLNDIQTYIRHAAEHDRVQQWIQARALTDVEFITHLAGKSEYNFMYLHYVLGDIEDGRYDNLTIEKLPKGLEGYYDDHWQRMGMTSKPLPREKIKIIYVLVECEQTISRQLISELAIEDNLTVQEVLDEWGQFLLQQKIDQQFCYSIYHTSFSDFLHRKDIVQAAGVTIASINTLIADKLWEGAFEDE